jgi:hypothetical protein
MNVCINNEMRWREEIFFQNRSLRSKPSLTLFFCIIFRLFLCYEEFVPFVHYLWSILFALPQNVILDCENEPYL